MSSTRCAITSVSVSEWNTWPAWKVAAQLLIVLDDAVVHDRHAGALAGLDGMGVALRHPAVVRRARMSQAGWSRVGSRPQRVAQHLHLADPAGDVNLAVDQADARGVVASVLEPLETGQQALLGFPVPDVSDDATHEWLYPDLSRHDSGQVGANARRRWPASSASTITRTTRPVPNHTPRQPSSPGFEGGLDRHHTTWHPPARCGRPHRNQLLGDGVISRPASSMLMPSRRSAASSDSAVAGPSPVVCRSEIDDVARLLAAERRALTRPCRPEHVAVADVGHLHGGRRARASAGGIPGWSST